MQALMILSTSISWETYDQLIQFCIFELVIFYWCENNAEETEQENQTKVINK